MRELWNFLSFKTFMLRRQIAFSRLPPLLYGQWSFITGLRCRPRHNARSGSLERYYVRRRFSHGLGRPRAERRRGKAADCWTSPWFGSFFLVKNGWLRHETIGWLFAANDGAGGVWLWQENLGWLWTGADIYPYLFLNTEKGWVFLLGDTGGRVFIYRFSDTSWFDVAEGMDRK